jgi:hypothetical protein
VPDISLTDLSKYAGVIAMACFAGTFLGGLLLSYFWKTFGPWKQMEDIKMQLARCQAREVEAQVREIRVNAELADVKARLDIMREAILRSGFELQIDKLGR